MTVVVAVVACVGVPLIVVAGVTGMVVVALVPEIVTAPPGIGVPLATLFHF